MCGQAPTTLYIIGIDNHPKLPKIGYEPVPMELELYQKSYHAAQLGGTCT